MPGRTRYLDGVAGGGRYQFQSPSSFAFTRPNA